MGEIELHSNLAQPSLEVRFDPNEVREFMHESNSQLHRMYSGVTYNPEVRRRIHKYYLPTVLSERFSGRLPRYEPHGEHSEPQPFQDEVFWYTLQTTVSKHGAITKFRHQSVYDIELDSEMEADLQAVYYGVKAAILTLDRVQTPGRLRSDNMFPQVSVQTIFSAINDNVFERNLFINESNVEARLNEGENTHRDFLAKRVVGKTSLAMYRQSAELQKNCSLDVLVSTSIKSAQLIIEQLAHSYFASTRVGRHK